jgi:hypothetical protein
LKAKLSFPDGSVAVLDDGRWTCDNQVMAALLNANYNDSGPHMGFYPWELNARMAARDYGAEILHLDPTPPIQGLPRNQIY